MFPIPVHEINETHTPQKIKTFLNCEIQNKHTVLILNAIFKGHFLHTFFILEVAKQL